MICDYGGSMVVDSLAILPHTWDLASLYFLPVRAWLPSMYHSFRTYSKIMPVRFVEHCPFLLLLSNSKV